mmetsp:Transcript_100511/g.197302  ORF Transcript_100511/g.197302 Transcript_100511/m.197302 type:complete len:1236 (-) Transcript_100511:73-3780(-)
MAELNNSMKNSYSTLPEQESTLSSDEATTASGADALHHLLSYTDNGNTLGMLVTRCIDDCLVSVQKLRSLADLKTLTEKGTFVGCFGEKLQPRHPQEEVSGVEMSDVDNRPNAVVLSDCVALGVSSLAACQLQKVSLTLAQINSLLSRRLDVATVREKEVASAVLNTLQPVVQLLTQSFCALLDGLVLQYKSVGKLLYICVRIFRTLLAKGICSATIEDGEGEGSGDLSNMLFEDDVEGTGMGEGEGKKDVSDQIENEEQLLGLKDDAPKDPGDAKKQEKKTLKEEEKDQGVEMAQDFDGEMFDVPSDDEQDNNSEEDDGEEPEKEMGDANAEDIVDEKQWDDKEEEGSEDGGDKEEEKFEKDSKMQGDAIEGEMHTKENDDEGNDKDKPDDKEGKEKAPEKSEDADQNDDQSPGNDKEDDRINEDKEENNTEKPMGVDVRNDKKPEPQEGEDEEVGEEMEPEEGEDDNEKDKEKGEEQEGEDGKPLGGDDDGEKDPDAKDEDGGDLPDDMQLDGDQDDAKDEGEAEPEGMDVDEAENPENPDDEEDKNQSAGNAGEEGEEPPEENSANVVPVGGAGDLPEQDKEEQSEQPEEEDEAEEEHAETNDSDPSKPASYGVRNDDGKEALLNAQDDGAEEGDENKNASKDQQQQPPSAASTEQPQGKGGVSQGESKKGATHEIGGTHREDDGDQPPPSRNQEPPNPFKQAGNVNEKWHRRLNLVLPPEEAGAEQDDGKAQADDSADADDQDVPDGGGKGLYEHATKEEGAMEQVLADVAEDEAVQLPESGEQQQDNKRDLNSAMEQDNDSAEDNAKKEPEDRKRDREDERYRGQKAKKKRLNEDTAPEPVEGALENEPEDEEEVDDEIDQMNVDSDSDGSEEDEGADGGGSDVGAQDEKDVFEGTKVFTKDAFKFGATSDLPDAVDPNTVDEVNVNQADNLTISANRLAKGRLVWQQHRMATESYSMRLCEQLRLILEPTLATRLRGDYRTGKRINMRKVIPYVASGFRKDKIWLRRAKPAKRAYQVMIMIDDSMSMGAAGPLALSSLATIANALTRLEIGELSIASFATEVNVLHKFGTPFTEESGAKVVSQFKFQASSTLLSASLSAVLPVFTQARSGAQSTAAGANATVLQICFVISDARIDSDNREKLENTVRTLSEQHILVVLVIIDCNDDPKDSIFNTKSVSFVNNKVVTKSYFDDFPFPYYVALQKVEALPDVLSDALKQWFELVRLQSGNA